MEITDDNILDIFAGVSGEDGPAYSSDYFEASDVFKDDTLPHTFEDILSSDFYDVPKQSKNEPHAEDETVKMVEADIAQAQSLLARVLRSRNDRENTADKSKPIEVPPGVAAPSAVSVSADRRREILAQLAAERSERRGFASDREKVHLEASREAKAASKSMSAPVTANTYQASVSEITTHTKTEPPKHAAADANTSFGRTSILSTDFEHGLTDFDRSQPPMVSALPTAATTYAAPNNALSSSHSGATTSKSDRDALIARLLAERQTKKLSASMTLPNNTISSPTHRVKTSPILQQRRSVTVSSVSASAKKSGRPETPELLRKLRAEAAAKLASKQKDDDGGLAGTMVKTATVQPTAHPFLTTPSGPAMLPKQEDDRTTPAKSVSPSGSLPLNWSERGKTFHRKSKQELEQEASERLKATCTFKPAVGPPPPPPNKDTETAAPERARAGSVSRAERLAKLAQDRTRLLREREEARKQKEEEEMRQCTFRPNVPAAKPAGVPANAAPAHDTAKAKARPEPAEAPAVPREPQKVSIQTVNRLYKEGERRIISRAKAKAELERKALADLTFKPTISKTSEILASGTGRPESMLLPSEEAAQSLRLSNNPDRTARRPIYDRVDEIQRAKHAKLALLRMESEMAHPDLTFQPKINHLSERIAAAKMQHEFEEHTPSNAAYIIPEGNTNLLYDSQSSFGRRASSAGPSRPGNKRAGVAAATARLARDAEEAHVRRAMRAEAAARSEASKYTFVPKVGREAEELAVQRLISIGVDEASARRMSFLQRQEALQQHHEQMQQAAARQLAEAEGCTFKPEIGNAEFVLAHARPAQVMETDAERIERLSKLDVQQREAARVARAKEMMEAHTFHPAINASSRARGRAHTIEEHMRNDEGKRAKLRAAALAEAEFKAKHPFQPHLITADGSRSRSPNENNGAFRLAVASDPEHISERIDDLMRAKAAKLEAARRLREYEELRECTFQPELKSKKADDIQHDPSQEAVIIRGLGRFLELRDLSKQMEEEKREREAAAFAVKGLPVAFDVPGVPRPPTVPEPFNLTTQHKSSHARSLSPSVAPPPIPQQQNATATGRDATNRGLSKRQMLAHLLDNSS